MHRLPIPRRAAGVAALALTCALAAPAYAAAPTLTVDAASPATGPDALRPDRPAPNGTVRPFDARADLASPANGFARPAVVKDVIDGYPDIHAAAFVNDGLYGNGSSWIGASPDAWVKIDLGRVVLVDGVRLGRDRTGGFDDRDPGAIVVQLASADDVYAAGDEQSDASEYATVFDSSALGFSGQIDGAQTLRAAFTPTAARYVKVRVAAPGAALDEVEVSGQVEVDACATSPCGPDMACTDRPGLDASAAGRTCACAPGFVAGGDGACAMAGPVTLKVAYAGSKSSPNGRMLTALAQRWASLSANQVQVQLVPLGPVMGESDVVKKLRIHAYHGALLSTFGLHFLSPDALALDVPGLVRSAAERDQVLATVGPALEAALDGKGYTVATWGEVGATRVFSTVARPTVAELQKAKLLVPEGEPALGAAMKALGFVAPMVVSEYDTLPTLQTGVIDAVALAPAVALASGANGKARVMSDLIWSWNDEALVLDKASWLQVSQALRAKLLAAARDLGQQQVRDARADEASALTKLKAVGGQVAPFSQAAAWYALLEQVYPTRYRGTLVPAAAFDAVVQRLRELRTPPAPK
ncbi:MAG: TRAP transporter substrate-binding protein DctP [Myxococcota bacterium]